jgi:hypothetical protein
MEKSNQKEKVKKQKHPVDKKVTGQKNKSNNDGSPARPMKNEEEMKESMGSGKRQDDN